VIADISRPEVDRSGYGPVYTVMRDGEGLCIRILELRDHLERRFDQTWPGPLLCRQKSIVTIEVGVGS
jgi:hypothetical protein